MCLHQSVLTAKCPYDEVYVRRSVCTANCPTAKSPTAKIPTAKNLVTAETCAFAWILWIFRYTRQLKYSSLCTKTLIHLSNVAFPPENKIVSAIRLGETVEIIVVRVPVQVFFGVRCLQVWKFVMLLKMSVRLLFVYPGCNSFAFLKLNLGLASQSGLMVIRKYLLSVCSQPYVRSTVYLLSARFL